MKRSELKKIIKEEIINEIKGGSAFFPFFDPVKPDSTNPKLKKELEPWLNQMIEKGVIDYQGKILNREKYEEEKEKLSLKNKKLDEMGLNEMAKIVGDLESAITKVINDNPDLDGLPLKKAIKADDAVESALEGDTLYDNQLNKFIDLKKGRREVGKGGRKADPNKPKAEKKPGTGKRGRPAGVNKKKDGVAKTTKFASGKGSSYTTGKEGDEPTDAELRKLARSGGKMVKGKTAQLRQQEARKMWNAWSREMEKKGIVDSANRILDKERFEAERVKQKPIIQAAVAKIEG